MEYYISNGELHHWGIKGMRWGQRRYQNKDGSLTPAGRKRYEKEMERLKAEKRKIRNEKATANKMRKLEELQKDVDAKKKALAEEKKNGKKEVEKKLTPEEEKAKYEAEKKHAIEKGDAKEVLKFKGDLTQQEMQAAKARLQWEQDVRNFIPKDEDAGKTAAEKVFDKVNHGVKYAGIGIKAYNTAINVINAFSNNPVPLPKIELDVVKGNKDDRLKKKKEKEKADREEAEARAKEAAEKKAERVKQKESEKAAKEAQEKVNRYNEHWYENDESVRAKNRSSEYNMKGDDVRDSKFDPKAKPKKEYDSEPLTGEVIGEGTSRRKTEERSSRKYDDFVDATYEDISDSSYTSSGRSYTNSDVSFFLNPATNMPVPVVDSGRNYIAGLLEAPKNR